jgi:hypothetical protein
MTKKKKVLQHRQLTSTSVSGNWRLLLFLLEQQKKFLRIEKKSENAMRAGNLIKLFSFMLRWAIIGP